MPSRRHFTYLLFIGAAVLIAVLLTLPVLINSESVRTQLQTAVQEQTGGKFDYQHAEFAVLPRPTITLHQVEIDIVNQAQGSIASIQLSPELWPLLSGQVRPDTVVLDTPDINLNLPATEAKTAADTAPLSLQQIQSQLIQRTELFASAAPGLSLLIKNGSLAFSQDNRPLGSLKGLTLKMGLDMATPDSGKIYLKSSVSALTLNQKQNDITLEGLTLNGESHTSQDNLSFTLNNLALTRPALQISGTLAVSSNAPAFSLELLGADIDVNGTREAALILAGDLSPVKEVFSYLRGGKVPQISLHAEGEDLSELGDLKNILIEGQLQTGAVSIPDIKLDLDEVNGDVVISDGILQGNNVSTRLQGSSGKEGFLKVSLVEGNDLFQMELMLSANLAEAQEIVKRIVNNPTFDHELGKITNLKGVSTGKLTLGDSLSNINARVEAKNLQLSADHQDLPFPVKITKGQVAFTENQIGFKDLQGAIGESTFAALVCKLNWGKDMRLDISSGRLGLVLHEFYPWLASLQATKASFGVVEQITGTLNLSDLSIKGDLDNPEEWEVATVGQFEELNITTPHFPDKIKLASGNFNLDEDKLAFKKLQAKGLDAELSLSGVLKGLPRGITSAEISVDGRIGHNVVDWLGDRLEMPAGYAIRTPMLLSDVDLSWDTNATGTFKGGIVFDEGPHLSLDGSYHSKQLQLKRLTFKDQHSDANLAFDYGQEAISLQFAGTLQHDTLDNIFVNQTFGRGRITGDFSVNVPRSTESVPTAKGHLKGDGVAIPMPSGKTIEIEQIKLAAGDVQLKAEATSLVWNDLTWAPVKTIISFDQDQINVDIAQAALCGIDASGSLSLAGDELALDLTLEGKALSVETSYSCLTGGQVKMTGDLDFFSKLTSQGTPGELLNNLQGPLEMKFTNGLIEQSKLMARTLEILNVTEIVKGKLPRLNRDGFAYSSIDIQGSFQGEKLLVDKMQMNGDTLNVLGQGELDFKEETINAELLASPFKTADTVVRNIPGINYLLAGTLVAIPVSIKGKQADPRVRIMPASSVGSSLLSLGGRVIKSPLKLIETASPDKSEVKE